MIRFNCDYLEGTHPRILERLSETNFEQTPGYGQDEYCERARALRLKEAFLEKGYPLLYDSYTNQQFPIIPKEQLKELEKKFSFELWESMDEEYSAVRFCTSWATKDEDVTALVEAIGELS